MDSSIPSHWRIELDECTGPITPKFQRFTTIHIDAQSTPGTIYVRERAQFIGGQAQQQTDFTGSLLPELTSPLTALLNETYLQGLSDDLLSEKQLARVGTALCLCTIEIDSKNRSFRYTLPRLEDDEARHHARFLDVLRTVALQHVKSQSTNQ